MEGDDQAPFTFTGLRNEDLGSGKHGDQMLSAMHRHLRPGLGRWTQRDPAGAVDGSNLFQYVNNRPLSLTDPSGLIIRFEDLRIASALSRIEQWSPLGRQLVDEASNEFELFTVQMLPDDLALAQSIAPGGIPVSEFLSRNLPIIGNLAFGYTGESSSVDVRTAFQAWMPGSASGRVLRHGRMVERMLCEDQLPIANTPIYISIGTRRVAQQAGFDGDPEEVHPDDIDFVAWVLGHELVHGLGAPGSETSPAPMYSRFGTPEFLEQQIKTDLHVRGYGR